MLPRISFIELPTADASLCASFYASAFGWTLTPFGPTYACTLTGDVDLGLQADASEATAAPLAVVQVEELDAALAAVLRAGGLITKPVFAFPGGRRFHFRDPGGNELGVFEADASDI